jgi:transcriptional regulator with XRE-family HTH domain
VLQQLRGKGWSDADIADQLGAARETIYRWRMGQRHPENVRPVLQSLRQLLRRAGPPQRKGHAVAAHGVARGAPRVLLPR